MSKMASNTAFGSISVRPRQLMKIPPEEEVVISGIAGRYPESDNIEELHENLMSKKDLITDDGRRWKIGMYYCEVEVKLFKKSQMEQNSSLY